MRKNNALALLILSAFLLQGCANTNTTKKASNSQIKPISRSNNTQNPNDKQSQLPSLQKCLKEAEVLTKLNSKHQSDYRELLNLFNDAKFYASISEVTSEGIKSTIAPLFEYKINDKCNAISQLLIKEFKDKVEKSESINGNL